jgi:hypothetical protein
MAPLLPRGMIGFRHVPLAAPEPSYTRDRSARKGCALSGSGTQLILARCSVYAIDLRELI